MKMRKRRLPCAFARRNARADACARDVERDEMKQNETRNEMKRGRQSQQQRRDGQGGGKGEEMKHGRNLWDDDTRGTHASVACTLIAMSLYA